MKCVFSILWNDSWREEKRREEREKRADRTEGEREREREREVIVLDKALQLHVLLKQLILYLRNITSDKTNLFKTKKKGGNC